MMVNIDEYRDAFSFPDWNNVELVSEAFWPTDTAQAELEEDMDGFLTTMTSVIDVVAEVAADIPGVGTVVSLGIGSLWAAVQPGAVHKYQEPMRVMVGNIVASKLEDLELRNARGSLDEFNKYVNNAIGFNVPQSDDDLDDAKEMALLHSGYVRPDGLLHRAFTTSLVHLKWFSADSHELVISALQASLQSYRVQLMCWQAIAFRRRVKGRISEYNAAQLKVIKLLRGLPKLFIGFHSSVMQRIEQLKQARLNSIEKQWDECERNEASEHRKDRPSKYYTAMWLYDPVSCRNVLRADLILASTWSKVMDAASILNRYRYGNQADMRPDGSKDNEHLHQIMDAAMTRYKDVLLPGHMNEPFDKLVKGITKVVNSAIELAEFNQPAQLKKAPVFVTGAAPQATSEQALHGLTKGDKISYRYALHNDENQPELVSTPWSALTENIEQGKLEPIYVGDGYAAKEITRKVYRRTSETDTVGILVATLTGHGIMQWPEETSEATI